MRITLADHGDSFSTRARAELVADSIERDGSVVVVDFAGVRQVSGSFVDEILSQLGAEVAVVGLEAADVERVVTQVAGRRGVALQPV